MKFILPSLLLIVQSACAQKADTSSSVHRTLWGNSTFFSPYYTFSRSDELGFDIGRSYGISYKSGALPINENSTIGLGYSLSVRRKEVAHNIRVFYEYLNTIYSLRADYIYDITNRVHYLRPSVSFIGLVYYNYSFVLGKGTNLYKHGLTLRARLFHKRENWKIVNEY